MRSQLGLFVRYFIIIRGIYGDHLFPADGFTIYVGDAEYRGLIRVSHLAMRVHLSRGDQMPGAKEQEMRNGVSILTLLPKQVIIMIAVNRYQPADALFSIKAH